MKFKKISVLLNLFRRGVSASADALTLGTALVGPDASGSLWWLAVATGLVAAEVAVKTKNHVASAVTCQQILQQIRAGKHLASDIIDTIELKQPARQLPELDLAIERLTPNDERRPPLMFYRILKQVEHSMDDSFDRLRSDVGVGLCSIGNQLAKHAFLLEELLVRVTASDEAKHLTQIMTSDGTVKEQLELIKCVEKIKESSIADADKLQMLEQSVFDLSKMCQELPRAVSDLVVEKLTPIIREQLGSTWLQLNPNAFLKEAIDEFSGNLRQSNAILRQLEEISERLAISVGVTLSSAGGFRSSAEGIEYIERLATDLTNQSKENLIARGVFGDIESVVGELPDPSGKAAEHFLSKQGNLVETAEKQLSRIAQVRRNGANASGNLEYDEFERKYCLALASHLDFLELYGVDVPDALGRRYPLSVAYVSLCLDDGDDRVPVESVLESNSRILIRGEAGSGKTTILQWIAVQAASKSFSSEFLQPFSGRVPFFIRLREKKLAQLAHPSVYFAKAVSHLCTVLPPGWLQEKLDLGQAIFLIDGVDEVKKQDRHEVQAWIESLSATYPDAPIVVTSRPEAASEDWLLDTGFMTAELAPMVAVEISQFVDNWYASASRQEKRPSVRSSFQSLAADLKSKVLTTPGLRRIATNPLLCAMLCAFQKSSRGKLPDDKCDLYDKCVNILLEERDKARKAEAAEVVGLTLKIKRAFVEDLAMWFMDNRYVTANSEEVIKRISWKIDSLQHVSFQPANVFQFLVERSNLLKKVSAESVEFTHKTFQEFLAAKECLNQRTVGKLANSCTDDQWHEVISLFCGICPKADRDNLVDKLLKTATKKKGKKRLHLQLLAFEGASAGIEKISEGLLIRLNKSLDGLIPPKNLTMAKQVATAGDRVVPYLVHQTDHNSATKCACIRALGIIGGKLAASAMLPYTKSPKKREHSELANAAISDPDSFKFLFSKLDYVQLSSFEEVHLYCGIIGSMADIRISSFKGVNYDSIEALSSLGVELLTIENATDMVDLEAISPLSSDLIELRIYGARRLFDIEYIYHFQSLRKLVLSEVPKLGSVSVLAELPRLRELVIEDAPGIQDIRPLRHLTNTVISLSGLKPDLFVPETLSECIS